MRRAGILLAPAPYLTLALFLGPVLAGLAGTALPAFGYLPALGGTGFSLAPWRELLAAPGLGKAAGLSLGVGLGSTALSFALVVALLAYWQGGRAFRLARRLIAPLLALPHVAAAFGLAFLIAPSGWLIRLAAPLLGLDRPPDLLTVQDPWGLALTLGLVLKETPFLLLVALAALNQVDARGHLAAARGLGYGRAMGWIKAVLPQVYPQIRLPLFAVLAYAMSVVDVALILGPTTPKPLSPMLLGWFNDPDLALRFKASAGALLQLGLVVATLALWRGLESLAGRLGRRWIARGARGGTGGVGKALSGAAALLTFGAAALGLVAMAVWSVAKFWRFPDAWPAGLTLAGWARQLDRLAWPGWNTLSVGLASTAVALMLVLACLEAEDRRRIGRSEPERRHGLWLVYIPLLAPQIAFLFGAQTLLIRAGLDGSWIAVVWSHLLFVLPYMFLALADPFRALDERYARSARSLGAGPDRVFWRIKLPLLLRPILAASAIGLAVSVGQYLPTLFAGAGRVPTITTEAVGLAAGGDRRAIGALSIAQAALPFVAFAAALVIPRLWHRNRRGLEIKD